MKIPKVLLIIASILAILFLLFYIKSSKNENVEKFQLSIENPQTTLHKGDKVTYTARLNNLTNKEYTLYHGAPLISLYIRNKSDETPEVINSIEVKSVLKPNGYIEQTLNIEALETGEYILRASSSFKAEETRYDLKCKDILITVVDN